MIEALTYFHSFLKVSGHIFYLHGRVFYIYTEISWLNANLHFKAVELGTIIRYRRYRTLENLTLYVGDLHHGGGAAGL
jgi:hypothetical protein